MSSTPEGKFKEETANVLRNDKQTWISVLQPDNIHRGIPDIQGCRNGWYFAFELKVSPNKLTRLQLINLVEIQRSGAICGIVTRFPVNGTIKFSDFQTASVLAYDSVYEFVEKVVIERCR